MDKIVFKPGDVRGGGNIIAPAKVLRDFQRYNCKLALSSTSIDNQPVNVFTESYLVGSYFNVSYSEWLPLDTVEFTLAVTLKHNSGSVITGASVSCTVNEDTVLTGTTDGSGKVSFTVPCTDYYVYTCRLEYKGNNNVAGCVRSFVVRIGEINHVDLISEDAYTATGEVEWLMATVTGQDGDGGIIPASYYPVTFYETYTHGLLVKSNTKVMEAGDNSVWAGQIIDDRDGSLVRLPDETLQFFEVFERDHINMNTLVPITVGDTAVLTARVFDTDNSYIRDVPVFFEEEIPGSSAYYCSPLTLSKDFVEEGTTATIGVRVRDMDNDSEPVPGVFVRFYADETGDNEVIIPDTRPLPTLTLSGPSSAVGTGTAYTISGVLGNVTSATNTQIKLYENDVLIDTLLCDSSGAFSKVITKSTAGEYKYKAVKEETGLYQRAESNIVIVTVNEAVITPTSISLTSDKSVLSYYDSESAVLSALVMGSDGNPMAEQSVVFKQGSTTLATKTTNESGVATYSYSSAGSGDVTFTAECSNLQETYEVEDCLITLLPETTISNSGGTKISSVGLDTVYNIQNTDFSLEFDGTGNGVLNIGAKNQWSSSYANYRATIGYADGKNYWAIRTSSTTEGYGSNASTSTEYHYKLTREGTTVKFYVDDSLIQTSTFSSFSSYSSWSIYSIIWGRGTQKVKNIKLKPL